jgi:hypothetical protein
MNKGFKYNPKQSPHGIQPLKGVCLSPTTVPQHTGHLANVPPEMREAKRYKEQHLSELPDHLFIPRTAQSLNLINRVVATEGDPPGLVATTYSIMSFTTPKSGGVMRIWDYALTTDAEDIEFRILINGHNALPYHGNPNNKFRIDKPTGIALSNLDLVECQLLLQPNNHVEVIMVNNTATGTFYGARLVGYFDADQVRRADRFGG